MLLAEVVGAVWGSVHAPGLDGYRLLEVRPVIAGRGPGTQLGDSVVVAVDRLGAGPGERVLVATGSRVRDLVFGPAGAFKSLVIAIVDDADLGLPAPRATNAKVPS